MALKVTLIARGRRHFQDVLAKGLRLICAQSSMMLRLPERRGSLTIDDEGTAGQNTVLIENGILKGYMQDKMNARLMGMAATGNGRRESYSHLAYATHDQHLYACR